MRTVKKMAFAGLLSLIGLAVVGVVHWTSFPGRITEPDLPPVVQGIRSTFQAGICYRHPGAPPMLELSGSHYEMGLQYGVLLRPEILLALEDYQAVLRHTSAKMGVPFPILTAVLKYRTRQMAGRLPQRFRDELRGVADGAGLREDAVIAVSLLYDVLMTGGCTGVLMRAADGGVIHGHSQEPYGFGYGGLLAKHTVVVRMRPDGYYTFTRIDPVLFLGVETGFNEQGLTYTEETYSIRNPNPAGFPIVYLARMALEEASTLEEVGRIMDRHSVAAPGGMLWSDRDEGRGMRLELLPSARAVHPFDEGILWDFNNIVDPELARQQQARVNLAGFNRDRALLAETFPEKPAYTPEDAVAFLRIRYGPDSLDYSRAGSHSAISNAWGQQLVVFDPAGAGFWMALGETFASRRAVFRYGDDFSQPPELFMDAEPIAPAVEAAARISTGLFTGPQRLEAFRELAGQYPGEPHLQFLAAYECFRQERWDLFAAYAREACRLSPQLPEYRLYVGIAAFLEGRSEEAAGFLKHIGMPALSPEQELYRLAVLAKADPDSAKVYQDAIHDILKANDAAENFHSEFTFPDPGTTPPSK